MIKAPYNFVPLNKKVFYPPWAEQVSHDIPFSDGESGEIDVIITAKSPIFVRNHSNDKNNASEEFCNYKGHYYIPGSSIKGMVRNVLEIMSFSQLKTDMNKKFSYRDFNEPNYKQKLLNNTNNIHMGWLRYINNQWQIEDLGVGYRTSNRIKYDDMNIANVDIIKSKRFAQEKYKLTGYKNPKVERGYIVFTGKVGREKTREFVFPEPNDNNTVYTLENEDLAVKSFKAAYYIGTTSENDLWKEVFRKRFNKGEKIPIFFILDNKQNIESFGLSMLYKLPYKYSVKDGMAEHAENLDSIDLAETIFGFTNKNINEEKVSLKGRVQFSHFRALNPQVDDKVTKILTSPRAGYYPMYSKNGNSMNSQYTISGWKRYPLHKTTDIETQSNENMETSFKPLKDGTIFVGKLRYHNLRPQEVGALLSALTKHGNFENLFHNLGMAKPFGFGEVQIELKIDIEKYFNYIQKYEELMQNWCKENGLGDWLQSSQLKELFATMTKPSTDGHLQYQGFQYYGDAKRNHTTREEYSNIIGFNYQINSVKNSQFQESIKNYFENSFVKTLSKIEKLKATQEMLNNTPKSSSKEFKNAIKNCITNGYGVPDSYYDYKYVKMFLDGKHDDITDDDIYNAYYEVFEDKAFERVEILLRKREQNKITEIELAELYNLLTQQGE